jgi:predicted Zn finger-like uncharacterized protein
MNVACPECSTVYRVDPDRVPGGGVWSRCRECGSTFRVEGGGSTRPGEVKEAQAVPAAPPARGVTTADVGTDAPAPPARTAAPAFGPQDPDTRARRLARALVSDIKVYNPDKWEESRAEGTLRKEFRDEILKSWEEYVEQVGDDMAKKSPYFRDALNDILAGGDRVF